MSPKKARLSGSDSFEDETTARFDRDGIPVMVDDGDETTVPVDVDEMAIAARRSKLVPDPDAPPRIIRRGSSAGEPRPGPYAEILVAGTGEVVQLPAHGVSRTGVSLEVPDGIALSLLEGATVMVHLYLGEPSGSVADLRLRACVAHLRRARQGVAGGVSMRWDTTHEPTAERIQAL